MKKSALSANDDEFHSVDIVYIGEYSNNLNTAISGIDAAEKTLIIDKDISLDAHTNVQDNILLKVIDSGSITLGDYDLIIHKIEAGPYPCFICNGSGKVNIGTGTTGIYPQWFGKGTLDDETLKTAITAMGSNHRTLIISPGTWLIDQNLKFNANTKLKFETDAVFDIDGAKVIINGDIDAAIHQIFDVEANSKLTFGAPITAHSTWFGVSSSASAANNISRLNIFFGSRAGTYFIDPVSSAIAINGPFVFPTSGVIEGHGATFEIADNTNATFNLLDIHGANGLTIKGIVLNGNKNNQISGRNTGISIGTSPTNILIDECTIYNCTYGIYINIGNNIQISNCNIYDNTTDGIALYGSTEVTINDNLLHNNGRLGVNCSPRDAIRSKHITQIENIVFSNGHGGLHCESSDDVLIKKNHCYLNCDAKDADFKYGGIIMGINTSGEVIENVVTNNAYSGIAVASGNNNYSVLISKNIVSDTTTADFTGSGINLSMDANSNTQLIITDNKSYNNTYDGIHLYMADDAFISNNYVGGNGKHGIFIGTNSNDCIISKNYVFDNSKKSPGSFYGIYLDRAFRCHVEDNTIKGDEHKAQIGYDQAHSILMRNNIADGTSLAFLEITTTLATNAGVNINNSWNYASTTPTSLIWAEGAFVQDSSASAEDNLGWRCINRQDTEIKARGNANDVNLDIDSTAEISAGDIVGIELDNDKIHWTSITNIIDNDTIILANALDANVSVDNDVWINRWVIENYENSTINALWYGTDHAAGTLQTTITAIGPNHCTLYIPCGTWKIDEDLNFNANTKLKFEKGAKFDINDATITIKGDIDADSYQIFDCTDRGTISFNSKRIKQLSPEWWGDTGDASMTALLLDDNFDICNSYYQWVKSNAGTNEYYLQLSGGGNPKINQPLLVSENDTNLKVGKVGSLAKGEWGWGDPSSKLGYNTIVVRLTNAETPDPDYKPVGSLVFQTGNKFFCCPTHAGGFQVNDCRLENFNKDYGFIYTDCYNKSILEIYIADRKLKQKFEIMPFQRFTYNPGILILEGDTYIKFFYIY